LEEFATLPESPEDIDLDDYAVINVSPSVVPHPYAPSFRIFSYNVTGDEGRKAGMLKQRNHRKHRGQYGDKETECGKEEWRRSWKCHLRGTWYSNPESPSRINQLWTPLGYAQVCGMSQGSDRILMRRDKYYVPHLEEADEEHEPEFELEYVTWGGKAGKTIYYGMSDLTVGSWVQLGQRLGQGEKQLRRVFKRHMYVGAGDRGRS
jgi:endopolyphosphatase